MEGVLKVVQIRCTICHKIKDIDTTDERLYKSPIVIDNYVCSPCSTDVKRIKVKLTCSKCKATFCTKIFVEHKDKYGANWVCPVCSAGNGEVKKGITKATGVAVGCVWCQHKRGVCPHPDVNCLLAKGFVSFNSSDLYSIKKVCTVMSISRVHKKRDDIHCLSYSLLYKTNYSISPENLVLIKHREGSKKNFVTNVIVYRFKKSKFEVVFNEKFDKGTDWIKPTKKFIMAEAPHLVE